MMKIHPRFLINNTLVAFSFCLISHTSFAQEVVATSGEHFSNSNGQMSFTVGETVVTTESNSNNTLTQGYHQTNLVVVVLNEVAEINDWLVYPNPVSQELNLEFPSANRDLIVNVISSNGKLVYSESYNGKSLNCSNWSSGNYILTIASRDKGVIKQFQIIKTD